VRHEVRAARARVAAAIARKGQPSDGSGAWSEHEAFIDLDAEVPVRLNVRQPESSSALTIASNASRVASWRPAVREDRRVG